VITDPALNYPFGGLNYNPPLFDWSVAIAAYPLTLFGYSTSEAASIALVFSTAIVGALTCIPVYLLAKEMFSRRIAVVASAFFAISAVAIVQTVFSNGTESAYFVFFFVLMTLFLLRALKAFKAVETTSLKASLFAPFGDKNVFRNMLFASLSLIALMLSWIGFLSVIMILSFIMVVQAVLDRLRGKSAMSYVSIYGSVMLFALLICSLYYALVMGMYMVIGGPLCLALLMIAISFIISFHRVWVITIPLSIVIAVVVLAAIWFTMPSLYTAMTAGFYPYADGKFSQLVNAYSSVTLSTQAIYAGVVTMWFSFIVAAIRIFGIPKNADSKPYMFITMWFVALIYMSWSNIDLAYLAAPMYAIGTGVVILWILRRIHIKDYIASFKGSTVKSVWRKIVKPVPLITVLATVFVLLMPNVLYAVDASIPSNEKANYNADMHLGSPDTGSMNYLGATNYFIKDNNWSLSTAWDEYADEEKSGALVTWLDYGAEAVARGNFQVVADHFGNGVSAASNILLGTSQEAVASMAVRLMLTENKAFWADKGIDGDLLKIIYDGEVPSSYVSKDTANNEFVRENPDIFGAVDYNITAENAMYMVAAYHLIQTLTDGEISELYNSVIGETEYEIGYIGVTGSMLPIYYGDNSMFGTMAYLNDYYLDRYASPSKYFYAGIPYYGYYYYYNDIMYETMIWKALVGMSLEDYRAFHNDPSLSFNTLMRGLMLSDGTYKAYPGFGLSNFEVDKWWVMYNPEDDASGEWELMDGRKAQKKQADERKGLINYLGGMSFLKYVEDCDQYEGTVVTPDCGECAGCLGAGDCTENKVKGMTVAFFDVDGELIGKTLTNADGRYGLMIPKYVDIGDTKLYSGSIYAMEVLKSPNDFATDGVTVEIEMSELEGKIVGLPSEMPGETIEDIIINMVGKNSGMVYSFNPDDKGVFEKDVVPDTYAVTMLLNDISIYSGTFTLYSGEMNVGEINVRTVVVEVTVRDRFSIVIPYANIEIVNGNGEVVASAETDSRGVAVMNVASGSYTVRLEGNGYDGKPCMLVSSSSTTNSVMFNAALGTTSRVSVIMVEAAEVKIDGVFPGDVITLTNSAYTWRGAYTVAVLASDDNIVGGSVSVYVPVGDYGNASSYTATRTVGGHMGDLVVDADGGSGAFALGAGALGVSTTSSGSGSEITITNTTGTALYVTLTSEASLSIDGTPVSGPTAVPVSGITIDAEWETGDDTDVEIMIFGGGTLHAKVGTDNKINASAWTKEVYHSIDITMTYDKSKDSTPDIIPSAGIVSFIREGDNMIITVPIGVLKDSDVPITHTVSLPEGNYTVYAYASGLEKRAYIGLLKVDGTNEPLNIRLVDAIVGSGNVQYSAVTSTSKVAFVPVIVTTTIDGEKHTVILSSDALGLYYMMIPKYGNKDTSGNVTVGSVYVSTTETLFGEFIRPVNTVTVAASTRTTDSSSAHITVNPVGTKEVIGLPVPRTDSVLISDAREYSDMLDVSDDGSTLYVGDLKFSVSNVAVIVDDDGTSEISIFNDSSETLYVVLRSENVTFSDGSETIGFIAIDGGATETIYAEWTDGDDLYTEILVKEYPFEVTGDSADVTVTVDNVTITGKNGTADIIFENKRTIQSYVLLVSENISFTAQPAGTPVAGLITVPANAGSTTGTVTVRASFDVTDDLAVEVLTASNELYSFKVNGEVINMTVELWASNVTSGTGTLRFTNNSGGALTYVLLESDIVRFSTSSSTSSAAAAVNELMSSVQAPPSSPAMVPLYMFYDAAESMGSEIKITLVSAARPIEIEGMPGLIADSSDLLDVSDDGSSITMLGSDLTVSVAVVDIDDGEGISEVTFTNTATEKWYVMLKSENVEFSVLGETVRFIEVPASGSVTIDAVWNEDDDIAVELFVLDGVRTNPGSFDLEWVSGVSKEMKMNIFKPDDFIVTVFKDATATATAEIRLENNTSTILYAVLDSKNATFSPDDKASSVWLNIYTAIILPGEYVDINAKYTGASDVDIWVVHTDMVVTLDGKAVNPLDPFPKIRTGTFDLRVEPSSTLPGDAGYYYSGKVTLFAGQTKINTMSLVEEVRVLVITTEDEEDKVTFNGVTARAIDNDKNLASVDKVYYVNDLTGTVIVESKDKDKIAYIDLNETIGSASIDVSDYNGDKVTVAGYVGRVADGEMTIMMSVAGDHIGTSVVPIKKGEYEAFLPRTIDGEEVRYEFYASVPDASKGTFTTVRTYEGDLEDLIPEDTGGKKLNDKVMISMEVTLFEVDDEDLLEMYISGKWPFGKAAPAGDLRDAILDEDAGSTMPSYHDIFGAITETYDGADELVRVISGLAKIVDYTDSYVITFEHGSKMTMTSTNLGGDPRTVFDGNAELKITGDLDLNDAILKKGSSLLINGVLYEAVGKDAVFDLECIGGEIVSYTTTKGTVSEKITGDDVIIEQKSAVFTPEGNMIKAVITMEVTNHHGSTVVLVPSKSWSSPTFDGTASYAVIPDDADALTVTMTAYFDPTKLGAGSEALSVLVRDLLGNTLQTKVFDTKGVNPSADPKSIVDALDEGVLEVTTIGNRVSKNEYWYAVTFTNTSHEWIQLTLSVKDFSTIDGKGFEDLGWYASIVDADNVKLDRDGGDVEIQLNGNSSVTYYVRLMLTNDVAAQPVADMYMEYGEGKEEKLRTTELTDLSVGGVAVTGDNLFSSMNGIPNAVWILVALIVLAALLIFWLGMRRGVFTRKR
jgi:asparagine N-glycosylation enzyme membrane subunit Stt3